MKIKSSFIKSTLIFSIVGIFIPEHTEYILLKSQRVLDLLGLEFSIAWISLWNLTSFTGLLLPFIFYSTDSDPGPARGPWYKTLVPPYFNQSLLAKSNSKSVVCKYIGLPGTRVVKPSGADVVHGGEYKYTRKKNISIDMLR